MLKYLYTHNNNKNKYTKGVINIKENIKLDMEPMYPNDNIQIVVEGYKSMIKFEESLKEEIERIKNTFSIPDLKDLCDKQNKYSNKIINKLNSIIRIYDVNLDKKTNNRIKRLNFEIAGIYFDKIKLQDKIKVIIDNHNKLIEELGLVNVKVNDDDTIEKI